MSEFNSIQRFINCLFIVIILCFLIFTIYEGIYALINNEFNFEILIHLFIIYFLSDIVVAFNDDSDMFIEKGYRFSKFVVVRIVYC